MNISARHFNVYHHQLHVLQLSSYKISCITHLFFNARLFSSCWSIAKLVDRVALDLLSNIWSHKGSSSLWCRVKGLALHGLVESAWQQGVKMKRYIHGATALVNLKVPSEHFRPICSLLFPSFFFLINYDIWFSLHISWLISRALKLMII